MGEPPRAVGASVADPAHTSRGAELAPTFRRSPGLALVDVRLSLEPVWRQPQGTGPTRCRYPADWPHSPQNFSPGAKAWPH